MSSEQKYCKIGLVLTILIFFISKWSAMHLPYFWDEAWSYIPAISGMVSHGLCLWPDCFDVNLYRGHPLFFYFIAAGWMKYVNDSVISMHLFALLMSILTIISFYRLILVSMLPRWALTGVILLISQEAFYVQSSYVLPEILIVFLSLELIRAYLTDQKILFIICGGVLGITKEIGLLIIFSVFIFELFKRKGRALSCGWISISLIPGVLFYIFQKIQLGWFFYPLHTDLITFTFEAIKNKLSIISGFLLLGLDRVVMIFLVTGLFMIKVKRTNNKELIIDALFLLLIGLYLLNVLKLYCVIGIVVILAYAMLRKYNFTDDERKLFRLGSVILVFVVLFSVINFLMIRYLIVLLPFVILFVLQFAQKIILKSQILLLIFVAIYTGASLVNFYQSYHNKEWHDDVSINYMNAVKVHQELIQYCETKAWYKENILTQFLLSNDLIHPEAGYRNTIATFEHVRYGGSLELSDSIVLLSCIEEDESLRNSLIQNPAYHLEQRFEHHKAWAEIYRKNQ